MAARVYDEVVGYIEDATKTLPGAAAPGELPEVTLRHSVIIDQRNDSHWRLPPAFYIEPYFLLPRCIEPHAGWNYGIVTPFL